MYTSGTPFVSEHYTKQDYLNIHLSIDSNETDFERAIDIFVDRIKGRFFDQIQLLADDYNKNGFAIMALQIPFLIRLLKLPNWWVM